MQTDQTVMTKSLASDEPRCSRNSLRT